MDLQQDWSKSVEANPFTMVSYKRLDPENVRFSNAALLGGSALTQENESVS